jgi:hypothetical protein
MERFYWRKGLITSILPIISLLVVGFGCGSSPSSDSTEETPVETENSETSATAESFIPVDGLVTFQTQCPYGTLSTAKAFRVGLWDCPTSLTRVSLKASPPTLMLQADCQKKLITVRTADRGMDLTWETLPDGTFALSIPGLTAEFQEDGSGGGDCVQPLTVSVWGKLKCQDRERAEIQFESVWWLKGDATPPTGRRSCGFATSCYLHTPIRLNQCS